MGLVTPQTLAAQRRQQNTMAALGHLLRIPEAYEALEATVGDLEPRTVTFMQGLDGPNNLTVEVAVTVRPERPDDFPGVA